MCCRYMKLLIEYQIYKRIGQKNSGTLMMVELVLFVIMQIR